MSDSLQREFVRLLARSGWTQSEAARKLMLTDSAISHFVSGKAKPSLMTLKLFKLMIGDMSPVPGEKEMSLELREGMRPTDADEQALLEMLRALDVPTRKAALECFRTLAGLMMKQRDVRYPKASE